MCRCLFLRAPLLQSSQEGLPDDQRKKKRTACVVVTACVPREENLGCWNRAGVGLSYPTLLFYYTFMCRTRQDSFSV